MAADDSRENRARDSREDTAGDVDPGGDTGGDTEMFRAFVQSSETYQPRAASRGPFVVAGIAVLIAVIAFVVIVALG